MNIKDWTNETRRCIKCGSSRVVSFEGNDVALRSGYVKELNVESLYTEEDRDLIAEGRIPDFNTNHCFQCGYTSNSFMKTMFYLENEWKSAGFEMKINSESEDISISIESIEGSERIIIDHRGLIGNVSIQSLSSSLLSDTLNTIQLYLKRD